MNFFENSTLGLPSMTAFDDSLREQLSYEQMHALTTKGA